jgi:hypothetical protein
MQIQSKFNALQGSVQAASRNTVSPTTVSPVKFGLNVDFLDVAGIVFATVMAGLVQAQVMSRPYLKVREQEVRELLERCRFSTSTSSVRGLTVKIFNYDDTPNRQNAWIQVGPVIIRNNLLPFNETDRLEKLDGVRILQSEKPLSEMGLTVLQPSDVEIAVLLGKQCHTLLLFDKRAPRNVESSKQQEALRIQGLPKAIEDLYVRFLSNFSIVSVHDVVTGLSDDPEKQRAEWLNRKSKTVRT